LHALWGVCSFLPVIWAQSLMQLADRQLTSMA
jgi:hypothetical protein